MLETRLIKRTENGWESATYVWDKKNTKAELQTSGKQFELWNPGGVKSWHAPSSSECAACHVEAAGYVLGLTTAQLNGAGDSGANQIETWAEKGYVSLPEDFDLSAAAKFCSPHDVSCDLEDRIRVWMDVNCAMCHRPLGPGNANIDLRYETALESTKMINVSPAQGHLGIEDALLVSPGEPNRSLLLERVKTLGAGRMPNIGSNQIDEQGVQLLTEWIKSLDH
jgi:mono/diheme cytochrome c family protein